MVNAFYPKMLGLILGETSANTST